MLVSAIRFSFWTRARFQRRTYRRLCSVDDLPGLFEHHTKLLNCARIDDLTARLVTGDLTNEEVYDDDGHGCLVIESSPDVPFVAVTGPQRHVMDGSTLNPYAAAPFGDMMLTGSFGLVRAFARRVPDWQPEIEGALGLPGG